MKPDDVTQDAWDAAGTYTQLWASGPGTVRMTVARAIMAAKAEEREACAVLAEEYEDDHDKDSSTRIAAEIRKRMENAE